MEVQVYPSLHRRVIVRVQGPALLPPQARVWGREKEQQLQSPLPPLSPKQLQQFP